MATLKDVAAEAGLTVTTVSRVLNNRGYISDNARKKVDEAMKKLNYQPNELARSLHNKSSNIIGLIVPHISHPYFAKTISSVEKYASAYGYHVLLCNTQGHDTRIEDYISICVRNRVAGIIICSGTVSPELLSKLEMPIIGLERKLEEATACIECDNKAGSRYVAETLIQVGCRRLVYIGSDTRDDVMPADDRLLGFEKTCQEHGLDIRVIATDENTFGKINYYDLLEQLFQEEEIPDGIFASSDVIAAQTLQCCRKHGIQVPEQVKIVGFDDVNIATLTAPTITTIHQPVDEMAELAVRYLKDALDGKIVPQRSILPVQIVRRESL